MNLKQFSRRHFLSGASVIVLTGCSRDTRPVTIARKPGDAPIRVGSSVPTAEKQISYAIELQTDGATQRVSESHPFRGGDKFRLMLSPSFSAYLYLFNYGAGEQQYSTLFPTSDSQMSNPIPSGNQSPVPDVWLDFDKQPGVEHFVVVVSGSPVSELETETRSQKIPRDRLDAVLERIERQFAPRNLRRNADGDLVRISSSDSVSNTVFVLRLPLKHD